MDSYNYINDCKNLLDEETEEEDVFIDLIGSDCMPGYARARCVDKKKDINMPIIPK